MIAFLSLGALAGLFLFSLCLGGIAGIADANARLMQDRPEPRPLLPMARCTLFPLNPEQDDCDVYDGCSTVGDEGERLIGLYCADRELRAAAERMEATR